MLGIRETRHFQGRQSLTADDVTSARRFDDWVVERAFFNFDVHNLTGASLDETGVQFQWKQPDSLVKEIRISDNILRRRVLSFPPLKADKIAVSVSSTHGNKPARIFEVRAY